MIVPNLASAWRYRHFILSSIRAEIRARFIRSKLGGLWMIVHPLAQAAIFALVLSEIMSAKLPGMANDRSAYALYLLSGLLGWSLFSELVNRCLTLFIDNGNLLKKIQFPRICLPIIVAGSALLNNALLLLAIILVFAVFGRFPGTGLAWVPALMLLTLATGLADPRALVVDGTRLVIANAGCSNHPANDMDFLGGGQGPGGVIAIAKSGETAATIVDRPTRVVDVAIDRDAVYWLGSMSEGQIGRSPR